MILYDSDNPDSIPDGVFAAGYVDGYAAPAWAARGWRRFPNARRIAVFASTNDGDVLDVERLNATPDQVPGWLRMRHAKGIRQPWVYCNRSNRAACENAMVAAGILTDQAALWVATLDGTQTVPAGRYPIAAVQYANSALAGGHYDLSIVNPVYAAGGGSVTPDDLNVVHDLIQDDLWGLTDTSAQSRADFAYAVAHGTSIASIVEGWKQNPQYAKWQAAKASIGQAGGAALSVEQARQLAEVDSVLAIAQALKAELDAEQAKLKAAGAALGA